MRECDEIAIFILEWIIVEWHHAARGDAKLIIDGEGVVKKNLSDCYQAEKNYIARWGLSHIDHALRLRFKWNSPFFKIVFQTY